MDESFGREEKLKSKTLITRLFEEGRSLKIFPLKLVYLPISRLDFTTHKTAVSVPKRSIKKAVDRIHLKRLMRESFRKNKYLVDTNSAKFAFMFIFVGKQQEDFHRIEAAIRKLLKEFGEKELSTNKK